MKSRILAVLTAFVLVGASHGWAQETTGSVNGRVTDAQGLAVPGATVTLTGPQGSKSAVTDADGRYTVPLLVPGTYSAKAELQGFKTVQQQNVIVRLGQAIEVPLKMEVGGVAETIEVTASSPTVDTRSTTVGAVLDSETLKNIPVGRRFSDALYVAPGVVSSGSAGSANPSMAGGSGLDNQYVVDGVNITNTGYGALGSYSIIFGSLGNGTPYDFIKEVQVKTGGYEAEYGQAIGGVVNVVTKSGTNKVQGDVFGYTRPHGTESSFKEFQSPNGTVQTLGTDLSDFGVAIGGPAIKDKLFWFGAIDPSWETRTLQAPNNQDADGNYLFPLYKQGGIDRKREITSYSAKATYNLNTNHHFDASFFGDPAHGPNGPQRTSALLAQDTSQYSELTKYGGHNQTVSYNGVYSSKMVVEAAYSHAKNNIVETPSNNTWNVVDFRVVPNVTTGGIGFYEQGNSGTNSQYSVKATTILGGHQLRYGFLYEQIEYDNINQRTGPTFVAPNGQQTATGAQIQILPEITGLGQIYRVVRGNFVASHQTKQHYGDFFVQDTFTMLNDRLTVRPGVRYEQQTLVGNVISATGTTENDLTLSGNWAPRIGATYDVVGNGRSKIFANWGRFYAKIPNDLAARALSADAGISRADYYDAGLTQPIPDGVLTVTQTPGNPPSSSTNHFQQQGVGADLIDPSAKSSYVDEFVTGFEFEARPNMNVGVRYIHRSIPRVLEDVGPYPVGACTFENVGCSFDYTLTNPSPSTPVLTDLGASYEKPIHKYDAVEFTVDKRFSNNWSMQSSYTWSRLTGTFEGFYREDNGQSDPGITSLYDFPTNDPSYTAIGAPLGFLGDIRYLGALGAGPLPLDRTHVIKVFGNYTFNMGLNLGLGLTMNSGTPLTALAANPNYDSGGEIPMTPRGQGFQTADGFKTRTPFEYNTSMHADYAFKFGGQRLVVLADVFNIFNLQRTIGYDNFVEQSFGASNPNYGLPVSELVSGPQFQTPRQIRFGARFEF